MLAGCLQNYPPSPSSHKQIIEQPRLLFAKLAVFILVSRVLYIVAYTLDEDLLRTLFFVSAVSGIFDVGLGAIFPVVLSKYA